MNRAGMLSIVFAAAVTGACGGSDSVSSSPTAPSTTTTTTAPAAPTPQPAACVPANLHVVSIQGSIVTLEWNAVSGATEYSVLVGSTPSSSDQLSTNTSSTIYTWTAKGGRQYARVQARCNGTFGSSSNEVEYTVGN